jgi:hypothetical protein
MRRSRGWVRRALGLVPAMAIMMAGCSEKTGALTAAQEQRL